MLVNYSNVNISPIGQLLLFINQATSREIRFSSHLRKELIFLLAAALNFNSYDFMNKIEALLRVFTELFLNTVSFSQAKLMYLCRTGQIAYKDREGRLIK